MVPVAIVYPDARYHWGDGESLWANFRRVAGARRTRVRLAIGPALAVAPGRSEAVMNEARAWTEARIAEGLAPHPVAA